MNYFTPHLICLIEGNTEIRETLMTTLSAQGYLTNGFKDFQEAKSYLYNTISPLSLLLANNSLTHHDWSSFKHELSMMNRMKSAKFHTYQTPLNLPVLLDEIAALLK